MAIQHRGWTPIEGVDESDQSILPLPLPRIQNLQNWIGELQGTPKGETNVASFEIVAPLPADRVLERPTAVVLFRMHGTRSAAANKHLEPYTYMGDPAHFGLLAVRTQQTSGQEHPRPVVAGFGGKVQVLDAYFGGTTPTSPTSAILAQSADLGLGGLALALHDLDGDERDEIVFAPYFDPIGYGGEYARASLSILDYDPITQGLTTLQQVPLGGTPYDPHFPGWGATGALVADLDCNPNDTEILITTAAGEIVVFRWDPTVGAGGGLTQSGQPIYRGLVEGSAGAFHSIYAKDLIGPDGVPELYIATATGIRRFELCSASSP